VIERRALLTVCTVCERRRAYAVAAARRSACACSVSGAMSAPLGHTIVPASASACRRAKVARVAQRLEHAAVVEQVGEIYIGRGAVLEAHVYGVIIQRLGLGE